MGVLMDAAGFRRMLLGFTGATEGAHMGHPDFRVGGRIFATLNADETTAMVKLPVNQQARFIGTHSAFRPASGAWGLQGATLVDLAGAEEDVVGEAATIAWQNVAAGTRRGTKTTTRQKRNPARTSKH
jgi:hypothetical protein